MLETVNLTNDTIIYSQLLDGNDWKFVAMLENYPFNMQNHQIIIERVKKLLVFS